MSFLVSTVIKRKKGLKGGFLNTVSKENLFNIVKAERMSKERYRTWYLKIKAQFEVEQK